MKTRNLKAYCLFCAHRKLH